MKTGARKKCGFSLVEVMIATGILTIGFAFIAGVFPVGIKLVASATETTMAPIIEQEAFAKIRLYGVDDTSANWQLPNKSIAYVYVDVDSDGINDGLAPAAFNDLEYDYPSAVTTDDKNYSWSAICRYVGGASGTDVQVTVFVSRKAGAGAKYRNPFDPTPNNPFNADSFVERPMPIKMSITVDALNSRIFQINATTPFNLENDFIVPGSILVDDTDGTYRTVVSHSIIAGGVVQFEIDGVMPSMPPGALPGDVWVVPPAVGGSRNPCIGVYWQEPKGF